MLSGLVCNPKDGGGFGGTDGVGVVTTRCPNADFTAIVNDTGVLDAGWVREGPAVRVPLGAAGIDITGYDGLRMRVAVPQDSRNTTRAKQDFSIVLEDADGARASVAASAGTNGLQRLNPGNVQHALLNGLRLPLSSFTAIDLTRVRAVELRFDRTGGGRLALADLAFTQEGTGSAAASTTGVGPITPPQAFCRRSAASRWACAVGQLAWGRDPTPSEVAPLAAGYPTASGRQKASARALGGPTAAGLHHAQFLQTFLQEETYPESMDAALTASGRKYWDVAVVDLAASFANSPSLATAADVVQAAYESIAGRAADPSGLVRSAGARGRVVDERYRQILGRAPDASGRSYWVAKLADPGGEQALVASLMATESFRAAATH